MQIQAGTLYYAADRDGPPDVFRKVLDSPDADQAVLAEPAIQNPSDLSPDGTLLLCQTGHAPHLARPGVASRV